MIFVFGVWAFVRALLVNSAAVSLENVVLRQQLAVLQRSVRRPRLRRRDRLFWLWLARRRARAVRRHPLVPGLGHVPVDRGGMPAYDAAQSGGAIGERGGC